MTQELSNTLMPIMLSEIEDPLFDITVPITANIDIIKNAIKNNKKYPNPILAKYDDKLYPVGNLDSIRAADEVHTNTILCRVLEADDMNDVKLKHMLYSLSKTYNPIFFISLLKDMVKNGADISALPSQYRNLLSVKLDSDVERKTVSFLRDVGGKQPEVPSFTHVVVLISKLDSGKQMKALNKVITYSKLGKFVSVPDSKTVRKLFLDFDEGGEEIFEEEDFEEQRPQVGDAEVTVSSNPGEVGTKIDVSRDTIEWECECKRRYTLGLQNGTIKKLSDVDSGISAVDAGGKERYFLSRSDADYLGLEMSPNIHSYKLDSAAEGDVIILSKVDISKARRQSIKNIILKNS